MDSNQYSHAPDWRKQLRANSLRTSWVILLFFSIYLGLGLLIDTYLNLSPQTPTVSDTLWALLSFQITPVVTLVMLGVAGVSLWVTFHFSDQLMLLGTEYQLVPADSSDPTEKQLYHVVEELTLAAGMRYVPKIYIIDADYMNAFASGHSEKSAMVAITRGLLTKLDRSELQAVMAHELSHIRHGDIKLTMTASVLSNLTLMTLDVVFYNMMFARGENEEQRGNNQLAIIIMILRFLLPLVTVLLTFYLSRTREYMADAGCVELTRDNQPLGRALLKIHQDTLAHATQYNAAYRNTTHEDVRRASYLYDPSQAGISMVQSANNLFSTHPDLANRLKALGIEFDPALFNK
jgi:heat shock protein HtpX